MCNDNGMWRTRLPLRLRILLIAGAMSWGIYCMLYFRSMEWGFNLETFAIGSAFAFFPACYAAVSVKPLRLLTGALLVVLLSGAASEGYAGIEESLFKREHAGRELEPGPGREVRARWWPWSSHCLWYEPETGRFGADD